MVAVNCAQAHGGFFGNGGGDFLQGGGQAGGPVGAGRARRGALKALQILSALLAPTPGRRRDDAFEGQFVARIGDEFEVGGDVLDVGLFKEADAAGDAEGNVAAGQFELQFQGVKMGAIEDGHFFQARSLPRAVAGRAGRRRPPARGRRRRRPAPA